MLNRKPLTILFGIALALGAFFTTVPAIAYGVSFGKFDKGVQTFVGSDNAYLLSEPNRAKHFKALHIGDSVHILEQDKATETVHALKDFFYKVKVGRDTGYVWGGDLSKLIFASISQPRRAYSW